MALTQGAQPWVAGPHLQRVQAGWSSPVLVEGSGDQLCLFTVTAMSLVCPVLLGSCQGAGRRESCHHSCCISQGLPSAIILGTPQSIPSELRQCLPLAAPRATSLRHRGCPRPLCWQLESLLCPSLLMVRVAFFLSDSQSADLHVPCSSCHQPLPAAAGHAATSPATPSLRAVALLQASAAQDSFFQRLDVHPHGPVW